MNEPSKGIDWAEVKRRLERSALALERALAADPERIAALYRERAVQLGKRRVRAAVQPDLRRVLTFLLGEERYGVEFADVAELLAFDRCTPLPGAPAALCGVVNLHGEIRTVADLALLMELPGRDGTNGAALSGYVVCLRRGGRDAALRVDQLDRIQLVAAAELAVPEPAEAGTLLRYLQGIAADRLRLLSTDAILAHPLLQAAAM
jgi:purine-binding chemotaxis protein CheW